MDGLVIYLLSDLNDRDKNLMAGYSKK